MDNERKLVDIGFDVDHMAMKADIAAILDKYRDNHPLEILAVAAQVVGMIIALQDQAKISPQRAMDVVARNIEAGNQVATAPLSNPAGSA